MKIENLLTDDAVLAELGARLSQRRIELGLSQAALSEQAGVAKRTVERIEAGATSQTVTLVRIVRVLKLLERLDLWIPEPGPSPMDMLTLNDKRRKRVPRKKQKTATAPWRWGDDK